MPYEWKGLGYVSIAEVVRELQERVGAHDLLLDAHGRGVDALAERVERAEKKVDGLVDLVARLEKDVERNDAAVLRQIATLTGWLLELQYRVSRDKNDRLREDGETAAKVGSPCDAKETGSGRRIEYEVVRYHLGDEIDVLCASSAGEALDIAWRWMDRGSNCHCRILCDWQERPATRRPKAANTLEYVTAGTSNGHQV